jgi:hypothetical protein
MAGPLQSFADVQQLLNDFVSQGIPIGDAPHVDFWNNLTYDQFTTGNVPGVTSPQAFKILVVGNSGSSNIILALRGSGPFFGPGNDPGPMPPPPSAPMPSPDIDRIADWIDRKCPR